MTATVGGSMEQPQRSDIYDNFVTELPFGVLLLDGKRTAVCWNRRAEQITGFLRHEVIGHRCAELAMFGCEERNHNACESSECPLTSMPTHVRSSAPNFELQHKEGHSVQVTITLIQLTEFGSESGVAIIFQEKGAARELRQWMSRGQSYAEGELGLPPTSASREELRLSIRDTNTAVLLIEVNDAERMARHFGRELLHNGMRNVVHSITSLVHLPHFLGHWTAGRLLLLVPNCDAQKAATIAERIESASEKNRIRWWGDVVTLRVRATRVAMMDNDSAEMIEKRLEQCSANAALNEE